MANEVAFVAVDGQALTAESVKMMDYVHTRADAERNGNLRADAGGGGGIGASGCVGGLGCDSAKTVSRKMAHGGCGGSHFADANSRSGGAEASVGRTASTGTAGL